MERSVKESVTNASRVVSRSRRLFTSANTSRELHTVGKVEQLAGVKEHHCTTCNNVFQGDRDFQGHLQSQMHADMAFIAGDDVDIDEAFDVERTGGLC